MTSRDGKTRGRGAFIWLVVTLTVVIVLFIAGWYVAAHLARTRSRAIVAQLNAAGKTVDCRDASVIGFPISFGPIRASSDNRPGPRRTSTIMKASHWMWVGQASG